MDPPAACGGWSLSAISRHTGRDRKAIAKYLKGDGPGQHRRTAPSCLEPFRGYIAAIDPTVGTGTTWLCRSRPTSPSTPPFSWRQRSPAW